MQTTKRKLALLAGAALAIMAFGAASASAATVVEDAATGEPCSAVQPPVEPGAEPFGFLMGTTANYESGGCTVEVGSDRYAYVGTWAFGGQNTCNVNFDAHVGPDGWGYADNFQFEGCTVGTNPCPGDRIIAPAEYNPDPFKTGKGLFKYTNASTDLNVVLCGDVPQIQRFWGFSSFDLGAPGAGQVWDHQQTDEPHPYFYYVTGTDWFTLSGSELSITH